MKPLQKHPVLWLGLCLWLSASVLFVPPTRAQEMTLTFYDTVVSTLAPGASEDWTLIAPAGAVVSFVVRAADDAFDPTLTILEGGTTLIANDDADPATTRDPALEAITLPRAGTYTVRVAAYASAGGDYTLAVLPGYAQNPLRDDFDEAGGWTALNDGLAVTQGDGRLLLDLSGIEQQGGAVNPDAVMFDHAYADAAFEVTRTRGSWAVGLLVRQTDSGAYLFEINDRGQWRFVLRQGTTDTVLREWTAHPAIVAGTTRFDLGVLMNGAELALFYNAQGIGILNDATLSAPGRIGFAVRTGSGLDSAVTVAVDSLTVTMPSDPPIFPQQLLVADGSTMIQELSRRGLIPPSQSSLNVPEAFVDYASAGVTTLRLGRGEQYSTFALGATVSWEAGFPEAPAGCGLVLGLTGDRDYTVAYLNQNGDVAVSDRSEDIFTPGLYDDLGTFNGSPHHLLVVAEADMLHYFVDGRHRGSLAQPAVEGEIGVAAINYEPVTISCRFANLWLASFDASSS
ncbi:MAG: hypothetical protein IT320_09630 [Anaerolineae bacterium]|nr:hypothetical protein [Anaerolineae bacterium]